MERDMFDRYDLRVNLAQAVAIAKMLSQVDFSDKTAGEVMDLNWIAAQVDMILDAEKELAGLK